MFLAKLLLIYKGLNKCFLTKPKMKPIASWFPRQGLENMFFVASRAKHTHLFWETGPFWTQLLGWDPLGQYLSPLPAAQSEGAGVEGALRLTRGSAFVPASKGTGRNKARRGGKGQEGMSE